MSKSNLSLTARESQAMDLLWDADRPLSIPDMMEQLKDWKEGYIYLVMSSLEKKGFVHVAGFDRTSSKKYSRTFAPTISKEEYAARLAMSMNFGRDSVPRIALAMARESAGDDIDQTIAELEEIIQELKAQQNQER